MPNLGIHRRFQDSTDAALLGRLAPGADPWVWRELHDGYAELVRSYARRRGLPGSECDDVVQEVFLRLIRGASGFRYDRARGRFRGFLHTLTARAVADRFRRLRREEAWRRGAAQEGEGASTTAPTESPLDVAWETEWRAWHAARAMHQIEIEFGPRDREAFRRSWLHGVPVAVVAAEMELSVEQVYKARSRISLRLAELVRARIRNELGHES